MPRTYDHKTLRQIQKDLNTAIEHLLWWPPSEPPEENIEAAKAMIATLRRLGLVVRRQYDILNRIQEVEGLGGEE